MDFQLYRGASHESPFRHFFYRLAFRGHFGVEKKDTGNTLGLRIVVVFRGR